MRRLQTKFGDGVKQGLPNTAKPTKNHKTLLEHLSTHKEQQQEGEGKDLFQKQNSLCSNQQL